MYRTIDAKFWTDPKVRQLSTTNKLLFLYFITSPHAHFSGLYYMPNTTVSHETGIRLADVGKGIDTLSGAEIVMADTLSELIWVVNMFEYQSHSIKLLRNIEKYLLDLHNSPLIGAFLERYSELDIPYRYPIGAVYHKEQEQRKEQDQHKEEPLPNDGEDFEQFWNEFKAMKRGVGKVAAKKAWHTTTFVGRPGDGGHRPIEFAVLIEAAKHYRMFCEQEKTEPKFIKQPATFLGPDRHWEDFKDAPSGNGSGTVTNSCKRGSDYYENARKKKEE